MKTPFRIAHCSQRRRRDIFVEPATPCFTSPVGATCAHRPMMPVLRSLDRYGFATYKYAAPTALPSPADKSRHDKLVVLVEKLLGLMPKLRAATSESEKATLQNAVTATDQQIDALVYELYGLTEEEIKLVEGNA